MRRTLTRLATTVASVAVGLTLVGAAPASAAPAAPAATAPTSGVDDWSCRPSAAHPEPVILLHGLSAPAGVNFATLAPGIAGNGYCVFTPQYGVNAYGFPGFNSMRDSAAEVGRFVDQVRATTGAAKVDLVGHSEGTTVSAYYLKFGGGASKVKHFVGFGANYKGTTLYGLNVLVRGLGLVINGPLTNVCAACNEFLPPSSFLTDLNAGGVTVAGPTYTNIVSRYDEVVVPYTSGILNEAGVENIVLQDRCWTDLAGHLSQAIDPNVQRNILWALNGRTGARPSCVPFLIPG
jgi:triacylglycerol esterase/lipase EstA (alpha/beta hydrolase family)